MIESMTKLKEKILYSNKLILCFFTISDNCNTFSSLELELNRHFDQFITNKDDIELYRICIKDTPHLFPRWQTDILYYFAPNNITPLFFRIGVEMIQDIGNDVDIAKKLINGVSYEIAKFGEKGSKQYFETQALLQEEEKKQYPPALTQVRNFAKDIWKSATRLGKNLPVLVPAEVADERITICRACEHLTSENRCTQCGCFMSAKVNLAASQCPMSKW